MASEVVLVRHGATEWSVEGRHTSSTDLPLTERGIAAAKAVASSLGRWRFDLVLSSPLRRAADTAALALGAIPIETTDNLREWNYGVYEGITTAQIHQADKDWNLWRDGAPSGEKPGDVSARADRVIERTDECQGAVAVFAHGHILRVLAARWLGLDAGAGALFALDTATVSVLGYEHDWRVLKLWNGTGTLGG